MIINQIDLFHGSGFDGLISWGWIDRFNSEAGTSEDIQAAAQQQDAHDYAIKAEAGTGVEDCAQFSGIESLAAVPGCYPQPFEIVGGEFYQGFFRRRVLDDVEQKFHHHYVNKLRISSFWAAMAGFPAASTFK